MTDRKPEAVAADDTAKKDADAKKKRRVAFAVGAVFILICRALPEEYQTPCNMIAQFCTGGLFSP